MIDTSKITFTETDVGSDKIQVHGRIILDAFVTIPKSGYLYPSEAKANLRRVLRQSLWEKTIGELRDPLAELFAKALYDAKEERDVQAVRQLIARIEGLLKDPNE